jgi:predicted Na+-dependent transporter
MGNRYLPLVVVAFMLALGLTLTVSDFRRAVALRRPLAVAMTCQALLLPALCLVVAELWHLARIFREMLPLTECRYAKVPVLQGIIGLL